MSDNANVPALQQARDIPLSRVTSIGALLQREQEVTGRLSAVAGRHLTGERAMRLAINAVKSTKNLAACDPASFMGGLMSATGLGLEPNTPSGHAFLIPYKTSRPRRDQNNKIVTDDKGKWIWDESYECQFQIGYKGFIALFYRSGVVTEVTAESIRAGDRFEHQKGTETYLKYQKSLGKRGDLLGSFAYTKLRDGQAFTILPLEEIYKLRSRSQTYNSLVAAVKKAEVEMQSGENEKKRRDLEKAQRTLAETPWVLWDDEMAAKSAIRRHAKQQDLGDETPMFSTAADLDALSDAGSLNIKSMADPEFANALFKGDAPIETMEQQEEESVDEETGEVTSNAAAGQKQITQSGEKPMETVQTEQRQAETVEQKPAETAPPKETKTAEAPKTQGDPPKQANTNKKRSLFPDE